ncbi:MAG: RDD family protein, partial [Bacteroidota bacterium]
VKNFLPVTILTHHIAFSGMAFTMGVTLAPVFYGVYFIVFDLVNDGRTLGKLMLGILVVSKDGAALSPKKQLLRSLYKMLSVLLLPLSIGLFLFKDHYTFQDYYMGTITLWRE